jgi:zinc protease
VVGDVEETVALAAVESGFGSQPPAPAPFPKVTIREGEQRGERRFNVHRAGEMGALALTWRIPEGLHPDLAAFEVLTQVLSDGVTSRLYQLLVETNLCLGVSATALALHDPGVFQVLASLAPEISHARVEEIIRNEVARLGRMPPAKDELARAKVQVRTDLAFHHESPGRIMAGLTEAVAVGDWRAFVRELELVSAVTEEDLERVAAASLIDHGLTVGWFVPDGNGGGPNPPAMEEV